MFYQNCCLNIKEDLNFSEIILLIHNSQFPESLKRINMALLKIKTINSQYNFMMVIKQYYLKVRTMSNTKYFKESL